jgi:hypothetical protein
VTAQEDVAVTPPVQASFSLKTMIDASNHHGRLLYHTLDFDNPASLTAARPSDATTSVTPPAFHA